MGSAGDVEFLPGPLSEETLVALAAGRGPLPERVAAVKELGRRAAPGGLRVLAAVMRDPAAPAALRSTAALAIGKDPAPQNRIALEGALGIEDPTVLRRVATALGRIGGPETLSRLRAVAQPKDPAAARALSFARSLIAYRHGLAEEWIKPPAVPRLRIAPGTGTALAHEALGGEAAQAVEARLRRELPGLPMAVAGGVALTCGHEHMALLPGAGAAQAARRSAVPAVVLKQSHSLGYFSVHLYLLSHPLGGGRIALWGLRPDGTLTHAGEAQAEKDGFGFRLEALETPHSPPMLVAGRLHTDPLRVAVTEARVAPGREASLARTRAPRQVVPPLPVTRTGPAKGVR